MYWLEGSKMKAIFDITKLWQSKPKHTSHKRKSIIKTQSKAYLSNDSWGMSPEDALRVTYSGNK
tara:strand:+ start:12841 stop:13032 length:192 start_codon:yes stop_codon:yes gene_type:complete